MREAGDTIELKVTPDPYVTVRYAGASGDFNPIHIDEEFAKQVGLPGRILHGLWTMAQVARAHTEARAAPTSSSAQRPVPRDGQAGEEIVVRAPSARRTRSRPSTPRPAVRPADHPQRRGRDPAERRRGVAPDVRPPRAGGPRATLRSRDPYLKSRRMLTQRQELVLRRLVEEYLDGARPWAPRRWPAFEWGPSTIRHELANLEELGLLAHPHTSAGRVPTEAGYRYFVDRLLPTSPPAPRCRCRWCGASSTRRCG